MDDPGGAQAGEERDGSGKRTPLREQLLEDPAVARLERHRLLVGELASDLACDRAREEAAAHPDPAVDPPAVDRHPLVGERPLPREHVRVDRVDERAVEIEDQRARHRLARPFQMPHAKLLVPRGWLELAAASRWERTRPYPSFAITCLICV